MLLQQAGITAGQILTGLALTLLNSLVQGVVYYVAIMLAVSHGMKLGREMFTPDDYRTRVGVVEKKGGGDDSRNS